MKNRKRNLFILLYIVFLVFLAFFLRSYKLLAFPPSLFIDEYNVGLPAIQILNGTFHLPWYGIGWYGVPVVHFYYIAGIMSFLGKNEWALRMAWVIPATLTIPASFFLFKNVFNTKTAIISSLLLTLSVVHIHLSRWAHGAIITPFLFFTSLALYVELKKSTRVGYRLFYSITCGFVLAFMVYTYLGGRLLFGLFWIYVLLDSFIPLLHTKKNEMSRVIKLGQPLLITFVTSIILLSPFLFYSANHQVEFWGRTDQAAVVNKFATPIDNLVALSKNLSLYAGLFWGGSDPNPKHTPVSTEPVFNYLFSFLFILGMLVYLLKEKTRSVPLIFLVIASLLGGILTVEAPSIFRTAAVIPFMCGLSGYLLNWLIHMKNWMVRHLGFVILIVVLIVFLQEVVKFFAIVQHPTDKQYTDFTYREKVIADIAYDYVSEGKDVYLLFDSYHYSSVKFVQEQHRDSTKGDAYKVYYDPSDISIEQSQDAVLIVDHSFVSMFDFYRSVWPNAIMKVRNEHSIYPIVIFELGPLKTDTTIFKNHFGLRATWYKDDSKKEIIYSKRILTPYSNWGNIPIASDPNYVEMIGYLHIPESDIYTFYGNADDLGGMDIIKISDVPLSNKDLLLSIPLVPNFYQTVNLERGIYRLKLTYKNLGGATNYSVTMKSVKIPQFSVISPLWLTPEN